MMLTAERLREIMDYDPASGVFTRRVAMRCAPAGVVIAGTPDGVSAPLPSGRYRARIRVDRREIYIGLFDTAREAHAAYASAARVLHGDFARAA